ncbi:MAG: 3-deoxy-manno-octulosonate cytidylyltransferase [Planctomycetes bacterium]|nr:3-deoxy-manno-octulosonate cytidylyltransferase [Planctomycetota bacterium]
MEKALVIIPARYGSRRLPGKVLLKKTGQYLVQHTYRQALKAKRVDRVIIATDNQRVYQAIQSFGGKVIMTSPKHPSGTDRVAEVARYQTGYDFIINVQADEPEISPAAIDRVVNLLARSKADMATLACPFTSRLEFRDLTKVKVWVGRQGFALDFFRSPRVRFKHKRPRVLRHIGIYGYQKKALLKFVQLRPTSREKSEKLEQLRAIENGFLIKVGIVRQAPAGIDTLKDYRTFVRKIKRI